MARRVLRLVAAASICAFALSAHAVSVTRASTDTRVADPPLTVVDAPSPPSDGQPAVDPPLPEPSPPEAPPEGPPEAAPDPPDPTPAATVAPDPSSPPPADAPPPDGSPVEPPVVADVPPSDTAGGTTTDTVPPAEVPPAGVPPAEVPPTDTVVGDAPPTDVTPPAEVPPPAEVIVPAPTDPPPADAPPADRPRVEVSATYVPPADTPPAGAPIVTAPPAAIAVHVGRSVGPPVSASSAAPRQDHLRAVAEPANFVTAEPAEAWPARTDAATLQPLAAAGVAVVAGMAVTNPVAASATVAIEFGRAGGGWAGGIVFNLWLRRQLRERRMSQRQLAALSGVDHSTISRLLRDGRHPSLATATKLVGALRRVGGDQTESDAADYFERMPEETIFPARRVEMALRADDQLDEAEVRRLMTIYLSARRKHQAFARGPAGPASRSAPTSASRAAPASASRAAPASASHAAPASSSHAAPASRAAQGSRAATDSLG